MNRSVYRGEAPAGLSPFGCLCLGLTLLVAAAGIWFFAPPIGFLGLLLGLGGGALVLCAGLKKLADGTALAVPARWLLGAVRVLALLLLVCFIAGECYILSGAHTSKDAEGADYLIVLGAQVNGTVPSLMLHARLTAALNYLERNPGAKAVLCGAQGGGEQITEAEAMRRWLEARGIDRGRLLLEDRSHDTIQNLQNAFVIIEADCGGAAPKLCVVSNEFHLRRAQLISRYEGHEVSVLNGPTPRVDLIVCYFVREFFSLCKVLIVYLL